MPSRRRFLILLPLLSVPTHTVAGAWSHESFANDGALDWVAEFRRTPTVEFLRSTLSAGTTGDFIESFTGESIIAAAEVVAASLGRPASDFPKDLGPIVAKASAQLRPLASLARSALAGVLGSKSELRETWGANTEAFASWQGHVKRLFERLAPGGA